MSDYGGLVAIIEEARATGREAAPLIACPRCGSLLDERSDGLRNCPMGHFRTNATTQGEIDGAY